MPDGERSSWEVDDVHGRGIVLVDASVLSGLSGAPGIFFRRHSTWPPLPIDGTEELCGIIFNTMSEPLQIVMDTSVLSAALRSKRGASFKLLSLVGVAPEFQINLSVPLVLEYEEVAKRQKDETGLTDQDIDDILDFLCSVANRRRIFFLWRPFLRDPGDDMLLELAVEARCTCIVTFNRRDFADVEEQFGIRVLGPKEFLQEIGQLQ